MTLNQIANLVSNPLFWQTEERINYLDIRIDYYPNWLQTTSPTGTELFYFNKPIICNFGTVVNGNQFKMNPTKHLFHFYWNRIELQTVVNCLNIYVPSGVKYSAWADTTINGFSRRLTDELGNYITY